MSVAYRQDRPLLTADEERELGLRAHAGDVAARDELVTRNYGLVLKYVKQHSGCAVGVERDDLVQCGMWGLIEAARRFDPADRPGVRFCTYAWFWIRHHINQYGYDQSWMLHLPRHLHDLEARDRKGRLLTDEQRSLLRRYWRARTVRTGGARASTPEDRHGEDPSVDVLADYRAGHEAEVDDADERAVRLTRAEAAIPVALSARERAIVRDRVMGGSTLKALAARLGVTKERVRQLEEHALAVLRDRLGVTS